MSFVMTNYTTGGSFTANNTMTNYVESVLYEDPVFTDGVTFTSEHRVTGAGQVEIPKRVVDSLVNPAKPGGKFEPTDYKNEMIAVTFNNAYMMEKEVHEYTALSVPYDVKYDAVDSVTTTIRDSRQRSILGALLPEYSGEPKEMITVDNIKDIILDARAVLKKKNVTGAVVVCSVDFYTTMLKVAGTEFMPVYNDSVVREGRVGKWMGITFIESNLLGEEGELQFYDHAGDLQAKSAAGFQFVMYDHKAFSVIDSLAVSRVIDATDFVGVRVQEEIITGMRKTNEDCFYYYYAPVTP